MITVQFPVKFQRNKIIFVKSHYMKLFTIITLTLIISACGTPYDNSKKDTGIIGKWTLVKEIWGEKEVNYDGIPTASKFEFKENGYYFYFDQITNEKIAKSGVGTIQENEKGQYIIDDNNLQLNHYEGDNLAIKIYQIKSQSASSLILVDMKSGKISHYIK